MGTVLIIIKNDAGTQIAGRLYTYVDDNQPNPKDISRDGFGDWIEKYLGEYEKITFNATGRLYAVQLPSLIEQIKRRMREIRNRR